MSDSHTETTDAVVVGAGFAGLYMLHRLRGLGLSARVYEAGDGVAIADVDGDGIDELVVAVVTSGNATMIGTC